MARPAKAAPDPAGSAAESGGLGSALRRALGVLIFLAAIALPLLRAPDRDVETLVARWAPPPSEFIDVHGQTVHLRDEGPRNDPLPVVLLHGTSASLHTWEPWVQALKGQRRVITLDLPGFGLTGPYTGRYAPAGAEPDYRGEAYAGFVLDVLNQLQVQRFVVGGNSLGGEIAWRVAALSGERVAQLILVDAAGLPQGPALVPLGWRLARTPGLAWLVEELLPRPLVAQGLAQVVGQPEKITPAQVDRYFELTLRAGNRTALTQRLRQWQPGEGAERINTLKLPTLILWGGRDALFPPAHGREFQQRIAGSQLVVFDDLGHIPHEEDPARTVVPVKSFLGLR
jgi:pimeloyl-ACP methyl ester carboxylesterase